MKPREYKRLRERVGSPERVAELLNIDPATIENREQGRRRVRREAEYALRYLESIERKNPSADTARLKSSRYGRPK